MVKSLPADATMYEAILANVSSSTVQTAISYYGRNYSFDRVFRWIDALADNFSAEFGIKKGDTVTLCLPNSPAALIAFYAANKLGAAVNLVHPFIPPEKLRESAEKTNSRLILVYDLYKCGSYDFGIPTLVSDSSYFMGAAAKAYYKLTNRRTAPGYIPFERYIKNRKNPHVSARKFGENEPAVYLASGGTTIRDFEGADGKLGYFVQNLKVYGHAGEPCSVCGTPIKRIVQGNRSTFFCPQCQK